MINPEMFQEWLESPVTEVFLKYLKDSADEEAELLKDAILNGAIFSEKEQAIKTTTCVVLNEISDIDLEEIESFYQKEDD